MQVINDVNYFKVLFCFLNHEFCQNPYTEIDLVTHTK